MIRHIARGLLARSLLASALALALSGCVTIFPKEEPEPLFTFGAGAAATPSAPVSGPRVAVMEETLGFDTMASSDRILTVTGNQVAYVKGGRWGAPAANLFQSAVLQAFDNSGGPARLVGRGQISRIDEVLKLNVLRFEARYDQGAGAPPTVVVRLRASLSKDTDRSFVAEHVFEARVPASENRVGPIATAYDQATSKVLADMVAWVNQPS